ncbi:MAG: type II toxin-antitoxin system PemK/MazF family toxin [Euryarchaeota archaeon]|nr:type II toxin-antitoxin system PemK/MazF family toxin [Euryarchaeota archaeon]
MRNYQIGEIVLLAFPYADQRGVKRRPALVLLDTGDGDVVVARVTSRQVQTMYDVKLIEWKQAGLLLLPVVRLHKLATLQKKTLAERRLGILATKDEIKGQSEDSTDMGFCLMCSTKIMQSHHPRRRRNCTGNTFAYALQLAASCGCWDAAADVNRDSRITSLDALMILRAAADAITL